MSKGVYHLYVTILKHKCRVTKFEVDGKRLLIRLSPINPLSER